MNVSASNVPQKLVNTVDKRFTSRVGNGYLSATDNPYKTLEDVDKDCVAAIIPWRDLTDTSFAYNYDRNKHKKQEIRDQNISIVKDSNVNRQSSSL